MYGALAIVAVVLILVFGALIALRMTATHKRKKAEWRLLTERATLAENVIRQFSKEINTAKSAGMGLDVFVLDNIIEEYEINVVSPNNKEIAR